MHPVLQGLVTDSARKLFQHYGLMLEIEPTAHRSLYHYAGVLGFTGEGIRGMLVVSASGPAVEATFPEGGSDDDREDWVGELCNQILGRIANRVIRYSMSIKMSTPVTFSGRDYTMQKSHWGEQQGWLMRGAGNADVYVHFSADVDEHVSWAVDEDAEDAPEEGDVMLF